MTDEPVEATLARHDERIKQLEANVKDIARIQATEVGKLEGWWEGRRASLIDDIRVDVEMRQLKAVRRLAWLVVAAMVSLAGTIAAGWLNV